MPQSLARVILHVVFSTKDRAPLLQPRNLSRTVTIASVVEEMKKSSSRWIKEQAARYRDFYWQGGYGAFSVSQSNVEQVCAYVANQEEHHRKLSFQEEFRVLCRKHGVAIDERHVWD